MVVWLPNDIIQLITKFYSPSKIGNYPIWIKIKNQITHYKVFCHDLLIDQPTTIFTKNPVNSNNNNFTIQKKKKKKLSLIFLNFNF